MGADSSSPKIQESSNANNKAQNVSAATEEQAATMREMTEASHRLADLASNLQKEVEHFKIRWIKVFKGL